MGGFLWIEAVRTLKATFVGEGNQEVSTQTFFENSPRLSFQFAVTRSTIPLTSRKGHPWHCQMNSG